jgi:hypothetical protein
LEIAGADHEVQPSSVAPHHLGGVVGIDDGQDLILAAR